jgi:hypothetical protein
MIQIIVCRNAAAPTGCPLDDPNLIWGEDISDELLNTIPAAQERGRVEIDKNYSNRIDLQLKMPKTEYKQIGSLQSVFDPVSMETKNGLVRNFQLSIQKSSRETLSITRSVQLEVLDD